MATTPIRVLICNDNGPPNQEELPFILPFVEHLEKKGWHVTVCLPNSQKSWIGKSMLIKDRIELSYYHRDTHEVSYHQRLANDFVLLSGTPSTCVNIALHHIFKDHSFDFILCGPNFGRNTSTPSTLSSGTIGAALEATLCRKKAIALSFPFFSRDFKMNEIQNSCMMASNVIQQIYEKDNWPINGLFNINVPLVDYDCPVHVTQFHQAYYGSLFKPLTETNNNKEGSVEEQVRLASESGNEPGRTVFKFAPNIKSMTNPNDAVPGTDAWALHNKYISVTPMIASYEVANLNQDYGVGSLNKL
ncbi:unnamed protein product [Absidia cylindrospora]